MAEFNFIGPDLLAQIYDLVEAGGTSRRPGSPVPGKQICCVRVTEPAEDGTDWSAGNVRTFSTGGYTDHAEEIEVRGFNDELLSERVYLAIRQGPSGDGVARYRADVTAILGECTPTQVVLSLVTPESVQAAIQDAIDGLTYEATITCNEDGTATASMTLTSGGEVGEVSTVDVTLQGCQLAEVE